MSSRIYHRHLILIVITLLTVSACTTKKQSITAQQATVDLSLLQTLPEGNISYEDKVRPVLEKRCVVCHGCYDAPCQLKLSSPAGITRGAGKVKVYNGARFTAIPPTRLHIDAKTTEQWRGKGFHSVLNEGTATPMDNLDQSVMYKMLRLKQMNPQSRVGMLADKIDLSLDREQTCPTFDEFEKYATKFPNEGMPFAMPNLKDEEYRMLVQWLAQGAPVPDAKKPSAAALKQIKHWETFLNGTDNKQKLVSRYIYEHLFIGHMHFEGSGDREFYRLVRSSTPAGQPVDEIATVRPYDDPGATFYYRLLRYPGDIVAKTHLVYELSDQRMARYQELFLKPDYVVTELPSWEPLIAANPFKAYQDIPPRSRYEFLLDDARYFIEGFIKGPVCRGMIALNVIEDHFWVAFLDPDKDTMLKKPDFLEKMSDYLQIPSTQGSNIRLLRTWKEYRERERKYAEGRFKHYSAANQYDIDEAMGFLWDGNGNNPNAALTIFRHYDSASVGYGFTGDYPETAWVIDYPLLERIHYLLVAGFNVFDNLRHQLITRLYMDFLRMEGEDMFLAFLPTTHRKAIRDSWYEGMRKGKDMTIGDTETWMSMDIVTGYKTDDPQRELYRHMERKFAKVLKSDDLINRCGEPPCHAKSADVDKRKADTAMRQIAGMNGYVLAAFPDVAFIRLRRDGKPENDLAYTVIRNKAYKNVTSMFEDEEDSETRDYSKDSLTVVDWLEGSYPNFFFTVDIDDVDLFAERYAAMQNREDYERFVSIYGTRRTNSGFWETADWFQDEYLREKPIQAGLFDLNRYQNR
ncbi:MAG: fatty acid cis/trans isomerase [Gammaproteobacteria bacterium]|nr:fatty acid cis/trans isomerase [Gammaproteobacteria bacterium]